MCNLILVQRTHFQGFSACSSLRRVALFTSSMLLRIPGELKCLVASARLRPSGFMMISTPVLARCGSTVWLPSSHLRASERQRYTMGLRTPDTSPGTMRNALLSVCHLNCQLNAAFCCSTPTPTHATRCPDHRVVSLQQEEDRVIIPCTTPVFTWAKYVEIELVFRSGTRARGSG